MFCSLVSFHKVIEISSRLSFDLLRGLFSGTVYVLLPASFKDSKPGNHFNKRHHFFSDWFTFESFTVAYLAGLDFLELLQQSMSLFLISFESSSLPMSSLSFLSTLIRVNSTLRCSANGWPFCFRLWWPEFPEQSVLSWTIPVPPVPMFLEPIARCCDRGRLEYDRCSVRIARPGILQLLDNVSCENKNDAW